MAPTRVVRCQEGRDRVVLGGASERGGRSPTNEWSDEPEVGAKMSGERERESARARTEELMNKAPRSDGEEVQD